MTTEKQTKLEKLEDEMLLYEDMHYSVHQSMPNLNDYPKKFKVLLEQ